VWESKLGNIERWSGRRVKRRTARAPLRRIDPVGLQRGTGDLVPHSSLWYSWRDSQERRERRGEIIGNKLRIGIFWDQRKWVTTPVGVFHVRHAVTQVLRWRRAVWLWAWRIRWGSRGGCDCTGLLLERMVGDVVMGQSISADDRNSCILVEGEAERTGRIHFFHLLLGNVSYDWWLTIDWETGETCKQNERVGKVLVVVSFHCDIGRVDIGVNFIP
jgi:hypothetical protein